MIFKKALFLPRACFNFKRLVTYSSSETIYALSSGQGKCGVAVIRVSGSYASHALKSMINTTALPKPRYAYLKTIIHPSTKETLDQGLVLWFPGPKSFTGEDCFELQVHGGIAVVSAVLNALSTLPNMRLAKPGEFTKRAFFNRKMDLTEVEGLADLIHAETEAQRKQALLQAHGSLSKVYNRWRDLLIRCVAHIEAYIDFDETDTLEVDIMKEAVETVVCLKSEMEKHLADGRKGERLRNGVKTVIFGEPNVGKSSLLNALSKKPAAIVTPIAGTTRDVLEVNLDIGGYPVVLMDTAGLRSYTTDVIEKEGISRALGSYETADLVIMMLDAEKFVEWCKLYSNSNPMDFLQHCLQNMFVEDIFTKEHVIVFNKIDLIQMNNNLFNCLKKNFFLISCKTEYGFTALISVLTEKLKNLCGTTSEHISMNQARHRQHITDCLRKLNDFLNAQNDVNVDAVLMAEHIRVALRHLGKLTGAVTSEQLLDVIFKDFCIGK